MKDASQRQLRMEPLEPRRVLDSAVVFNEIMYNPAGQTDDLLEWVELHNQLGVDVDVSGWTLSGGVDYAFAAGTVVPGDGLLVVAQSPDDLHAVTGYENALGPFVGRLSNEGERLRLRDGNGRVMSQVDYRDGGEWPVAPDGSGVSLAKRDPYGASEATENWAAASQVGGTPGQHNFPEELQPIGTIAAVRADAIWRYDASGADLQTSWRDPNFDDAEWDSNEGFAPPVLVTEIDTSAIDALEIQNVASGEVDTSGWFVMVNQARTGVTGVNTLTWALPDSMASGEVLFRHDDPVISENYWGDDIFWRTSSVGWVMIVDAAGNTVDALIWGYGEGDVAALDGLKIGEVTVNAAGAWNGVPATPPGSNESLQRRGASDNDDATDWDGRLAKSLGVSNDGLTVPFPGNGLRLPQGPTTHYFRSEFDFAHAPNLTELSLDFTIDDGAIFYLNGHEIHRHNMRGGVVQYDTLATNELDVPVTIRDVPVPIDHLVQGRNVLAAELHQARPGDDDAVFGAELKATLWPPDPRGEGFNLALNEVAGGGETPFWVEVTNHGLTVIDLDGYVLANSAGGEYRFPSGPILHGQFVSVDESELGFTAVDGDKLYLSTPDRVAVVDAVRVQQRARGRRTNGTDDWFYIDVATPNMPNRFALHDEIVINEIMYHAYPGRVEGEPFAESPEEWIELFNRSDDPIGLDGWRFDGAIDFEFPADTTLGPGEYLVVANDAAAMAAQYPGVDVLGNFDRALGNNGDHILLLDAAGNPADEVRYYDSGRWAEYADGGGASLELRDPNADNAKPEAWAASDETGQTAWQTVTYRGPATNLVGPTRYNELVLGLLDAGEILLDDIRVIEDPDGTARQLIQNGTFEGDVLGSPANKWRIIGTHEESGVIVDPDDPNNQVLRLVATGPTGHMHDHAGTTLKSGNSFVTIDTRKVYEISFRARWVAGSNQLNSRLYFNRLGRTTLLDVPEAAGTPGAVNSTSQPNIGPTYAELRHEPVVPRSGESVVVSVQAEAPDRVDAMTLRYRVDGGTWRSVPMTRASEIDYKATIPGQSTGRIVQFYVEGRDDAGVTSAFPAAGADSRALYKVYDGQQTSLDVHQFRIIMTSADANRLHTETNVMSNGRIGATVVFDEGEVFYDVGVKLKGSQRGRNRDVRVGFNVRFDPMQPFFGTHETVAIDRSGAGDQYSQKEILVKHTIAAAGGLPSMYDDLIHVITPRTTHTGSAMMQMSRYNDVFLDGQFAGGSQGTLFEYELIYYPTTTSGGVEGLKRPNPDSVMGVPLSSRGTDKEAYRWNFLIKNNRGADDYSGLIAALSAIGTSANAEFHRQTGELLDVDQWLRSFAAQSLWGVGDNYTTGAQHNGMFYTRPSDGKTLFFPWDMDFTASAGATSGLARNGDLNKLLTLPANRRAYYGHVHDIVNTTFNREYLDPWIAHYSAFLPRENLSGFAGYVGTRSNYALNTIRSGIPPTPFAITTNGGAPLSVDDVAVTIQGQGWVDVREIYLGDGQRPLQVEWPATNRWQVTVPLMPGENALEFSAVDFSGNPLTADTITVTSTALERPLQAFLRLSELNYDPADPTPEEEELGYGDEDFEFIELVNINTDDAALDLAGAAFVDGITFTFDEKTTLAPGAYAVLVRNPDAFAARYGAAIEPAGTYTGKLRNEGEQLRLVDAAGADVFNFTYNDTNPWPGRAAGKGAALESIDPAVTNPADYGLSTAWQSSFRYGGTPGQPSAPSSGVVINEVLTHTDVPLVDAIELHNVTDAPIDVGGWFLSDDWGWQHVADNGDYRKFRMPDGTVIPAGGYAVIYEGHYVGEELVVDQVREFGGTGPRDFALSSAEGDHVWLMETDRHGDLLRFGDHVQFPAAVNGESFGRMDADPGRLAPMQERTLGGENSPPRIGPIVISEIMYHPAPEAPQSVEFVELYNPTSEFVPLFDLRHPLNTWQFAGLDFRFPPQEEIPPGGVALVVAGDPETFRSIEQVPREVPIYGPYRGVLDGAGERLALLMPDEPTADDPPLLPYVLVDEVNYRPTAPWPVEADGTGPSLQRTAADAWGNEPASWQAAAPTPGVIDFSVGTEIVGRHIFYNNSSFDGNDPNPTSADDSAIAPDKAALLPGEKATFANYTSFGAGITGIMIDVAGTGGKINSDAFRFHVGNTFEPAGASVLAGAGVGGSDRITFIWPDNTLRNTWLQVTVLADVLGLATDDVFYFGNAVAEAGNSPADTRVTSTDLLLARNNPRNFLDPAEINFAYDYNRDQRVNATDVLFARNNVNSFLTELKLIEAPEG